jgi:hypothetical protein
MEEVEETKVRAVNNNSTAPMKRSLAGWLLRRNIRRSDIAPAIEVRRDELHNTGD